MVPFTNHLQKGMETSFSSETAKCINGPVHSLVKCFLAAATASWKKFHFCFDIIVVGIFI
jgi:hypothetical protein